MNYRSTRGSAAVKASEAIIKGLAPDGGLYVPESFPKIENIDALLPLSYKERAILGERVHIAMGGDKENPNVIEVISIACDECPMGGYEVTNACRGCLAHRCEDVCRFGAISFDKYQKAHIDKSKCKECGACNVQIA